MLYSFLKFFTQLLIFLINGNTHFKNLNRLPKGNYILVAPHRTWFDPVFFAWAAYPKKFSFMAKKELFKNPIARYFLKKLNAIPVDRNNPGPSAIKTPVKMLNNNNLSLIIFPSGTRHSKQLKGGAALISKLGKVPIVPAVYQGPLTFKKLFSRKPITISFGYTIHLNKKLKLNENGQKEIEEKMQNSFNELDKEINPNFHYKDVSKK